MKKTSILLILLLFISIGCSSDKESPKPEKSDIAAKISDGLDIAAIGLLFSEKNDLKTIEQELNRPNSINNLDIDRDGVVDYISIEEMEAGDSAKAFLLYTVTSNRRKTDIAKVEIASTDSDSAIVQVAGSEQVYGSNAIYYNRINTTDMLLMGWLFSQRPVYISPYNSFNYPPEYQSYKIRPISKYRNYVSKNYKTSSFQNVSKPVISTRKTPSPFGFGNNSGIKASNSQELQKEMNKVMKQVKTSFGGTKSTAKPKSSFGGTRSTAKPKSSFGGTKSKTSKPTTNTRKSSSYKRRK